jgi:hypothetical protein
MQQPNRHGTPIANQVGHWHEGDTQNTALKNAIKLRSSTADSCSLPSHSMCQRNCHLMAPGAPLQAYSTILSGLSRKLLWLLRIEEKEFGMAS